MKLPKLKLITGGYLGTRHGNELYDRDYYSVAHVEAFKDAAKQIEAENKELKAALTLIMRAAEGAKVNCGSDPEGPDATRNGALASIAAVAAQGLGLTRGPKLSEGL